MSGRPSFKILFRINLLVSLVISSLAVIFLLITHVDFVRAILVCVMGAFIVLCIGLADIYILGLNKNFDFYSTLTGKKKRLRYLLTYLASPVIYVLVWNLFRPFISDGQLLITQLPYLAIFTLSSWVMNALLTFFYSFNFVYQSKIQSEIENLKLKAIISETSNQVLKQQIHPHFLFNVLNTVKTLYKQDVTQGETYLVHLANFLRASLSNPTARIVNLENELQLCFDYIEMQRIRFGVALTYEVDVSDELRSQKFVPYFALQTLLENAIKHNDLTEEAPLNIQIKAEGDFIVVVNNFQPRHFKEPSTGQGLSNLSERYRLLTGAAIQILPTETEFKVRIKLLNNEDSHH